MAGRKKLTKKLVKDVGERIREGCFTHVAAAACGIHKATFYRWLAAGESEGATELEREFFEVVTQAKAQARAMAELAVFKEDPYRWLRYGPGRDKPDDAGWTSEAAIKVDGDLGPQTIQLVWPTRGVVGDDGDPDASED